MNGSMKHELRTCSASRIRSCHINGVDNDYPWQELFGLMRVFGIQPVDAL